MKTRVIIAAGCLVLALVQLGKTLHADDNIVGAIWEITFRAKGSDEVTKRYRATPRGKIFTVGPAPKVIGSWKGNREKTTMKITAAHAPRFNGDFEVTMIGKKTPSWRGKFTNTQGEDIPIKITLIRD